MSARIAKAKTQIALQESPFDGSTETEFISLMKDDGSFASGEENSPLPSQTFLESNDNTGAYRDIIHKNVTYKLIPLATSEDTVTNMQTSPGHNTYYVSIANPEVLTTDTTTVKTERGKRPQTRIQAVSHKSKAMTAKKRDDKRRATHNEVERRRRDKINTWIMNLADLVPNCGLPDAASKGGILAKACDHIVELNEKQKRLEKLEEDNEKLVLEVLRLNQELTDLRKENTSVRNQLADNCIVFCQRQKEDKS